MRIFQPSDVKSQALIKSPAEKMNVSGIDVVFPEESVGVGHHVVVDDRPLLPERAARKFRLQLKSGCSHIQPNGHPGF